MRAAPPLIVAGLPVTVLSRLYTGTTAVQHPQTHTESIDIAYRWATTIK
eukprot:COSAG05_NODE_1168_length_5629_cov_21.906691_3_plen_49_part_00